MHLTHQLIGQSVALLALVATIPYVVGIFKGITRPSRAAYAIWLVIDMLTIASYFASGARTTLWLTGAFALTTVIIFCLSIKYGMGGYSKLDLTCMGIALLALLLWLTTDNPVLALYTVLLAKMLGYTPVIKKAYAQPTTENTLSWGMTGLASALNLFALTTLQLKISLLPICIAITDVSIAFLLIFPALRLRAAKVGANVE